MIFQVDKDHRINLQLILWRTCVEKGGNLQWDQNNWSKTSKFHTIEPPTMVPKVHNQAVGLQL